MARASSPTLLTLDRWAEILGLDPRHFNQVTTTNKPVTTCSNVWKQYAWQENDQVSREEVAQAIQQAEDTIMNFLGYRLLPTWEADERTPTPQPGSLELFNVRGLSSRGFALSVRTKWGHFISGGIEQKDFIATPTISWNIDKTIGTITAVTDVTDEEEIAVYFPGEAGADEWEVKPLRSISISGGSVTITIWRHQLVDPDLWEAIDPSDVDLSNDANFVATVDIYRHWNDPQQQVQLIWSPRPNSCDCMTDACEQCNFATQWGCLLGRNYELGIVQYRPGTWDAADEAFDVTTFSLCRNPDRLRLWYYAGLQDQRRNWPKRQMSQLWERAITYYSVTLLDRPICGCNNVEKFAQKWAEDLAMTTGEASINLSDKWLDNPLGTERGAIFAWRMINELSERLGRAVRY